MDVKPRRESEEEWIDAGKKSRQRREGYKEEDSRKGGRGRGRGGTFRESAPGGRGGPAPRYSPSASHHVAPTPHVPTKQVGDAVESPHLGPLPPQAPDENPRKMAITAESLHTEGGADERSSAQNVMEVVADAEKRCGDELEESMEEAVKVAEAAMEPSVLPKEAFVASPLPATALGNVTARNAAPSVSVKRPETADQKEILLFSVNWAYVPPNGMFKCMSAWALLYFC